MTEAREGSQAGTVVDWPLAGRVARAIADADGDFAGLNGRVVSEVSDAAWERVLAYTGLEPVGAVPGVEVVSRAQWIASNLAELRELVGPLEQRAAAEISMPRPLGAVVRGAAGAASGVEAGALLGYASRRVLGQYQVGLGPRPRPARLLLVGRNLSATARELGVEERGFLLWVAIHEQTHVAQFAAVPWLRDHLAGLVARLIEGAAGGVDFSALAALGRRFVSRDPRRALRDALGGELARALAGPDHAATLDDVQAAMAVIEGHAEHVMDAASTDDEGLALMRKRLDKRRAQRGGLADLIARTMGMGMKLRQYELGKAWADGVTAAVGTGGLNQVWQGPEALPTVAELERPGAWVARVARAQVA